MRQDAGNGEPGVGTNIRRRTIVFVYIFESLVGIYQTPVIGGIGQNRVEFRFFEKVVYIARPDTDEVVLYR